MRHILVFLAFVLGANQCFSNLENYINQEIERNIQEHGCIKNLDFGFRKSIHLMKLTDIALDFILEKKDALNSLESLNLFGNNLSEIEIHNFIEKLVYLTPNLKNLNLSFNHIEFLGASSVSNVSHQWKHLETLSLHNANINADGMLSLFIKLSKHPNLKHLDVGSNAPFNEESAYKIGHRFAAFQHLESISFENLGLTNKLMDIFLKGMDAYKMPYQNECIMPLKSVHFGNELKSLSKIMNFMKMLDHTYLIDFYCDTKKYTLSKENHIVKIEEKYDLKIIKDHNKTIKQKRIHNIRSKL